MIYYSNKRDFVIYSDSYSVIMALKQFNSFHPLVQQAQEWLFRIHMKYKKVQFCWVPAHVGIQQNEEVDALAKEAAKLPSIGINHVPSSDMKGPIAKYILEKWQREWSSPTLANNKKFKKIKADVDFWASSYHPNRRYERALSRLRIGHTHLTHKHILSRDNPPVCDQCRVTLTVEHILVECPNFNPERRVNGLEGKSLKILLGEDVDIDSLMSFLKDIHIFYEV